MSLRERFRRGASVVHTDFEHYVAALSDADPEPGTIAYFDLDRTLIAGYSVMALAWGVLAAGVLVFLVFPFVLRWSGDANLDFGVSSPSTPFEPGGEFVYPAAGLDIYTNGEMGTHAAQPG